jgi:hypothetical protein
MTSSPKLALLATLCLLATACGGDVMPDPGPPVGKKLLPDLVPAPPGNLETKLVNGRWHVAFSTRIVNAGSGDFLLLAVRDGVAWRVDQGIPYSESGAEVVPVEAPLIWGGDGHDHWHIQRVASVRLGSKTAKILPEDGGRARIDSKIGFCFYDHTRELDRGPDERAYSASGCGHEGAAVVGMGLSIGWNDTYRSVLPGQSIDVSGLEDGSYRMWFEVDENAWFREKTRDNNVTWIDFDLFTKDDQRFALATATGPKPR